jgi:hypothetical protein
MPVRRLVVGIGVVTLFAAAAAWVVRGADHGDAPGVRVNSRLDINDVYAFRSPADASHTVLIMTVSPLAGITGATTFHPQGNYEFNIDTNGDAIANVTYQFTFSEPNAQGVQEIRLKTDGARPAVAARGTTGQTVALSGGGMFRAGIFDDPFFFDLLAFRNGLQFCPGGVGTNFFRGLNTLAIVLEVPSADLDSARIGVWARTSHGGRTIDRMGRPAINTVFIPSSLKDAFNEGEPINDRRDYLQIVTSKLQALGAANPAGIAQVLLPDILTVNTSDPSGFLNGGRLADDVIDAELGLITNHAVTTDCVANDSAFIGTFPYLAPPNP